MDEKLQKAYDAFYSHEYEASKDIFLEYGLTYEAGLASFLSGNLSLARKLFEIKEENCPASSFGIIVLDVLEGRPKKYPKYFQIRSFLEIYLNLLIENNFLEWAQKLIDNYEFFSRNNLEVPKFIARVLYANNCFRAVHSFSELGKRLCFYDAEVHYIDASVYIYEKEYEKAQKCIDECLTFAKEYYPIIRLQKELKEIRG